MKEGQGEAEDAGVEAVVLIGDYDPMWQVEGAVAAGQRIRTLIMRNWVYGSENYIDSHRVRASNEAFRQFVELLGRLPIRERVQAVQFIRLRFDLRRWFREGDIHRLFSDALPDLLATLGQLTFRECKLPADGLHSVLSRLLAHSSGGISLTKLLIQECDVDPTECAPLVVELIKRNGPITDLAFSPSPKMDTKTCQLIFNSLSHNTHLEYLEVGVTEFTDGLVVSSSTHSKLPRLQINVHFWNKKSKTYLARQLRTNTTLRILGVVYHQNAVPHRRQHRPWVEMLETYNFTLLHLAEDNARCLPQELPPDVHNPTVAACLLRNERIQDGIGQLGINLVLPSVLLLPRVLELASGVPTLLYRIVRHGDLKELADRLLRVAAAARRGGGGGGNGAWKLGLNRGPDDHHLERRLGHRLSNDAGVASVSPQERSLGYIIGACELSRAVHKTRGVLDALRVEFSHPTT